MIKLYKTYRKRDKSFGILYDCTIGLQLSFQHIGLPNFFIISLF